MTKPADYKEWHARRNDIAMTLCSALNRAEGGVCGCYNSDKEPDRVQFENCRKMVAAADKALEMVGVPVPAHEAKVR